MLLSHDLRLREELSSAPTPSEKGGCADVERSALYGDTSREQLGVCGIRVVREHAFLACSSDTLETLYCGTTPGCQSQVCPQCDSWLALDEASDCNMSRSL